VSLFFLELLYRFDSIANLLRSGYVLFFTFSISFGSDLSFSINSIPFLLIFISALLFLNILIGLVKSADIKLVWSEDG
jgi:hypothetical protein